MTRPRKIRNVCFCPKVNFFKPRGIPLRELEVIRLFPDEFETARLIDVMGFDQDRAAKEIGVSRVTIQRIYKNARRKIADCLVSGKALMIVSSGFCRCHCGKRNCVFVEQNKNNKLRGGEKDAKI